MAWKDYLKRCFAIKKHPCSYCGGSGIDPIDNGTCSECWGEKMVWYKNDLRSTTVQCKGG